ncbi:ABC transporter substrate-binding protein [Ruminococcaceae bacterium OttesenSCG-928-D13]|nr:ABC transporter substrate-binding protein [Ruminococcaceae bacterium OttesenSCG-928-D13]
MKIAKKIAAVLAASLIFTALLSGFMVPAAPALNAPAEVDLTPRDDYDWMRLSEEGITLNVYNWGEYISDGTDGESLDVNAAFEALTGIKVNYTTFDTNESLYAKLKSGGANYDVIIPSDYMIGKMINEDMLAPLNFANIPNFEFIGAEYRGLDYDKNDAYSVPYTWGYVGIIYNTTMVDDVVDSWEILWSEKYKNNILMFDNSRDAFAIASKKLGLSLNPTTAGEIDAAAHELMNQKDVVQGYVMDQIFDKMEGGEAALAPYYAGDAITMIEENPDLAFAVPKEGTNFFVDAACVPAGSKNQEAAEMYINFLCEPGVSLENTLYIGYSTPNTEAEEMLPDDWKNDPIAYPDAEVLANTETFNVLPDELNAHMDKAWSDMRGGNASGNGWIIPVALGAAIVIVVLVVVLGKKRKKRNSY